MSTYNFRKGAFNDTEPLQVLAMDSWSHFRNELTPGNWEQLNATLHNKNTFVHLLETADCIVCTTKDQKIAGMVFLIPSGNPTDIYPENWCYIRFLTVSPAHSGKGIGRCLSQQCIDLAQQRGEHTIALHTSEMMTNARRLYEHMSFEIVKEIPARLGKRYWLYKRAL